MINLFKKKIQNILIGLRKKSKKILKNYFYGGMKYRIPHSHKLLKKNFFFKLTFSKFAIDLLTTQTQTKILPKLETQTQ